MIPTGDSKDGFNGVIMPETAPARTGLPLDKTRRRKSKDRGRMGALWCASGQRSPTTSDYDSMLYDIPHLVRSNRPSAVSASPSSEASSPANGRVLIPKASSMDSGVDCKSSLESEKEDVQSSRPPLPSSAASFSNSKTAAAHRIPGVQSETGTDPTDPCGQNSNQAVIPKPPIWRSLSSFTLRTLTSRRKDSSSTRQQVAVNAADANGHAAECRMEQSRKRVGGSVPGDDRLSLSSPANNDDEVLRKRTHTQLMGDRLSRLSRSFRRRRSTDRVNSEVKAESNDSFKANQQTVVLYGTASRRRSSFKLSIPGYSSSSPSSADGNTTPPSSAERSAGGVGEENRYPGIPHQLSSDEGIHLVKILKLDQYMTNKWISGMAVSDKNELVLVDLREAYLVDDCGNLIRTIGSKGSERLIEPIGVAAGPEGRLIFTDHAEQNVKVFTNRGSHLRTVTDFALANIAGVACNRATGDIFVAGTDRKRVFVHCDGQTRTISGDNRGDSATGNGNRSRPAVFKHPFSVAYNATSRELIVGDDYDQSVMGVSIDGQMVWRFAPQAADGERQFFPSSVCVDQDGMVFVADLYNGKVFQLDAKGQFLRTLLYRGFGLCGNPGAIVTDGKGHIFVADEERTVKVFRYKQNC